MPSDLAHGARLEGANRESSRPAVSWAAIFVGAFASAAISLLLLILGSGLGLSSVSPWPGSGASVTTFTVVAAIWLIIVQWLSSGLGGYLSGRMRTKWADLHSDEVLFRDTVHGFMAWAVAAVLSATLIASAASSVASGGTHMAGSALSGAASTATQAASQSGSGGAAQDYAIDTLFRSDHPSANTSDQDAKAEAGRIVARDVANGSMPDGDKMYLAQLVSAKTGASQDDARKRVDDMVAQAQDAAQKAKQAADQTRKATATASYYTFFSMLVGAFIASVAGGLGGRHRDLL
jgi:hypothetical protein